MIGQSKCFSTNDWPIKVSVLNTFLFSQTFTSFNKACTFAISFVLVQLRNPYVKTYLSSGTNIKSVSFHDYHKIISHEIVMSRIFIANMWTWIKITSFMKLAVVNAKQSTSLNLNCL